MPGSADETDAAEYRSLLFSIAYGMTPDGWKFTERVYEVRYLDTSPLAGSAPRVAGAPADPPAGDKAAADGGR